MDQETALAIRETLLSLGWLPSDLSCEEKKRLADDYLNATTAWFDAGRGMRLALLQQLRETYSVLRQPEYEALRPAIEEARLRAARARLALEAHIAAHNC
jgi:hypothetical protein